MLPRRLKPPRVQAALVVLALLGWAFTPDVYAQTPAAAAGGDSRHSLGLGFGQVGLITGADSAFQGHIGFNLLYGFESGQTFGLLVALHVSSHSDDLSPDDSLSFKGLMPNLKVNLLRKDRFVLSLFGGMGAYLVSETLGGTSASFTLSALDAGAFAYVDVDPHFRFGPSITFIDISSAMSTPVSSSSSSSATTSAPIGAGGNNIEIFFNLMYIF